MRRRLIVIVVVLGVLVAADFGFRAYAEGKFAADIRDGLGLREDPDLDLGGFPFALAMARGRLSSANVHAEAVTYDGLRFERFDVRAEGRAVLGERAAGQRRRDDPRRERLGVGPRSPPRT